MIKKLRVHFVLFAALILLVVFTVMLVMLNLFMRQSSIRETNRRLHAIAAQDGVHAPPWHGQRLSSIFRSRHASLMTDQPRRAISSIRGQNSLQQPPIVSLHLPAHRRLALVVGID